MQQPGMMLPDGAFKNRYRSARNIRRRSARLPKIVGGTLYFGTSRREEREQQILLEKNSESCSHTFAKTTRNISILFISPFHRCPLEAQQGGDCIKSCAACIFKQSAVISQQ